MSVVLTLLYAGMEQEGQKYAAVFKPFASSFSEGTILWTDLSTKSSGEGGALGKCVLGRRHDMYSVCLKRIDASSVVQMLSEFAVLLEDYPAANESMVFFETYGQQGVGAVPSSDSAFPHRGRLNNYLTIEMAWMDDSAAQVGDAWAKKWRDHFGQPEISGYDALVVYLNYAHGDEPLSAIYGSEEWRQARLTALKNKYDPRGFFDGYHAIPRNITQWN
jgi:fumiquinazoline A oxidase